MPKPLQEIETWLDGEWAAFKAGLSAGWEAALPAVESLGQTVAGQILTGAETFVTSGGNFAEALAAITSQLPSDFIAGEHIIAGFLAAQINNLKLQQPAAPAGA